MEFDNKVTMSISSWQSYQNDADMEFAFGAVDFLSTRPNSHKHIYSEDIIKEYAPSVLGKWLVAEYSRWDNDVTTHTSEQHIIGIVPPNQEVKYRYDADGYLVASVDVVISKIYATEIYELFKTHNYRSVSVEELVSFSEETQEYVDGDREKEITGFNIVGITVLGLKYNPSVPNANIQLTQMSEDNVNKMSMAYIKYSQTDKIDIVIEKLESIEQKLNSNKEDIMPTELEKEEMAEATEVVNAESNQEEEAEVVNSDEEIVENAEGENEDYSQSEEVENACDENEAEPKEEVDNADEESENEVDDADTDEVENACGDKENMSELMAEISQYQEKISNLEMQIAELTEYKASVENKDKMVVVEQTMARIKDLLDIEEYTKYYNSGESCNYSEINAWKNEVLASVFDRAFDNNKTVLNGQEDIVDMGIPKDTNVINSIYD